MSVSDPIGNMLTKIRNAAMAKHEKVDIPSSRMKIEIVKIFKNEGFVKNFKLIDDKKQGLIRIFLKYTVDQAKVSAIQGIKRISKPGLRDYKCAPEVPRILNGLGTVVVTTSKGVLTDRKARENNVGGEVVCYIW
ncbi:MAG: 30S ribosomal protein S8 [Spirochaetes bacterium]|nr:30S ribosomal protein S8 [Spirochaetota bacterium]MCK5266935.1 30S ribosomal protein S8 [Spirochaetota bacterium]